MQHSRFKSILPGYELFGRMNLGSSDECIMRSVATIDRRMPTKIKKANWQHTFEREVFEIKGFSSKHLNITSLRDSISYDRMFEVNK
jgi:hypothetical protein